LITYLLLIAPLSEALSGGEGANPNISIGISRELILSFGYEITLLLSLLSIMSHFGTISLVEVIEAQQVSGWSLFSWPLVVPGIAYLLILPAILGTRPFDLATAPQEIASGLHTEYGGKYLGFSSLNHALTEFIGIALFVDLFMGGWGLYGILSPVASGGLEIFLGVIVFLAKIFFVYTLVLLVSAVLPRFRVDQAIHYLWKWPAALGFLGLLLVSLA